MTSDRVQRIVLVGGGHTHALVLHALKARPLRHAEITIINPGTTAPYSGMLPGFVAGHYGRAELDIDLQALAASLGGFAEFGVPAKPLANFATKWDAFRHSAGPKHVAIIGGGIAGAELAMAMAFALRNDPEDVTVRLLDRSQILSENSKTAQRRVRKALAQQGVTITEGAQVTAVCRRRLRAYETRAASKGGRVCGASGPRFDGQPASPDGGAGPSGLPPSGRLSETGVARRQTRVWRKERHRVVRSADVAIKRQDRPRLHGPIQNALSRAKARACSPRIPCSRPDLSPAQLRCAAPRAPAGCPLRR